MNIFKAAYPIVSPKHKVYNNNNNNNKGGGGNQSAMN